MSYASRLRRTQELKNWPGAPKMAVAAMDRIIEQREAKERRRRKVCPTCFVMTGTTGVCDQCN